MPLKGFCANAESPALVNPLTPNMVRISWGAWLTQNNGQYDALKWFIDLSDIDPAFPLTIANVIAIQNHSCHDHKYLLGNEPYLWQSPQEFVNECIAKMDIVLNGDEDAKFGIAAGNIGTSQSLWYQDNSWFKQVWAILPYLYRKKVIALCLHAYSGGLGLGDFLSASNTERNESYSTRALWLTEVGRTLDSPNNKYNPTNVANRCDEHNIALFCWYAQKANAYPANLYYCLQDSANNLTAYGQDFINL